MADSEMVHGLKIFDSQPVFCEDCQLGKMTRKSFPNEGSISVDVLDLVHSDLCGPMHVESLSGKKYLLTLTDDRSRYSAVYFLKSKTEVLQYFQQFRVEDKSVTKRKIRCLRTNNGTEYVNGSFDDYLKKNGIRRQLAAPNTPQQNGVAERLNRTLLDSARSMLSRSGLPHKFWAEAVYNAKYIQNRVPTARLVGMVPYTVFWEKKPTISHVRTFGCDAYVKIPSNQRKKLDPKAEKLIFMGYDILSKAYRLWDQKREEIVVSRDVTFDESSLSGRSDAGSNKADFKGIELELGAETVTDIEPEPETIPQAMSVPEVEV
jgi:hypothetical protein